MALSRDEQIENLKRLKSASLLHGVRPALLIAAAGLITAGAWTGQMIFYFAAAITGLAALAFHLTIPHRLNAARGVSEGIRQNGVVEITKKKWTVDAHNFESFTGRVFMDNRPMWQMDFAQPQEWEPSCGVHAGELAFIRGIDWPVAVILDGGILYPSAKPARVSTI